MTNTDKFREAYREEAYELLAELESALLELEKTPGDIELVSRAFRALHTIKGSGSMFGFDSIAAFTHEVETVFDLVREGQIPVTKELIDLTLSSRDHIRKLLDSPEENNGPEGNAILSTLTKLKRLPSPPEGKPAGTEDRTRDEGESAGGEITFRIQFHPCPDTFRKGINPALLFNELRTLGPCKVLAYTDAIPPLGSIDPEACYLYWDIILTTDKGLNAVKDVFIFVEDDCKLVIDEIDNAGKFGEEYSNKKVGEILVDRGFITKDDLTEVLSRQKRIGEMLIETKMVEPMRVEAALIEQQHLREIKRMQDPKPGCKETEAASSIRVSSDKLDRLVDLVGELVTVQARLTQTAVSRNDAGLTQIAEEVERLTAELRDNTMSVRLVPIGTLFNKFRRLVRDLSKETGKEVEMVTEGEETGLDKTVIERLNDPLVHLIRNCIDHGIEPPDKRAAGGKTRHGTVHLAARHSGGSVVIEIRDDGAGLDARAIREKAVAKGLVQPDAELSEKEIFSLIFAAGLSTAGQITNVSGRGVGMDVVKRGIEALRGAIGVRSKKGSGTIITLKLPLTLAIIEGLLVMIENEYFVLPLSAVEECVELKREDIARTHGRQIANVRGEIVPYISMREQFGMKENRPAIEQIVITEVEGQRAGFVVDHVIGEHQTVIKSLGRVYKNAEGISGATILGDGTVALILDIQKLYQIAKMEEVGA